MKNIPKIVDSSQSENESLSQSDIESMYQEFYKALECDNIDAVLVEIVNACLDSYLEKMKSHFPPEAIKSSQWKARIQVLEEIKAYIKYHGVPPALVEVLREMLVRWRKAPAYAVIEEDEIKNTD